MAHGNQSAFLPPVSRHPAILGSQVGVLCVTRCPSRLRQGFLEPAVPRCDASPCPLAGAFFSAGTHPSPRTVEQLPGHLKEHWPAIREHLLSGNCTPQPGRRVEIPKPDGGNRKLGIPTVLDRFNQQAVMQVLQRSWDETFSTHSYGFRPGRSAHQAVEQAQQYQAEGYRWVVDLDLEKFWESRSSSSRDECSSFRNPDDKITRMRETRSAGGVVMNGDSKILVVNQRGTSWSLPKGHIDPGEDAVTAAKREIGEESGIRELELIRELGTYQRYRIGVNGGEDRSELKTITMFLFQTKQEALKPSDPNNPEARWVARADVAKLLTHPKDKEFFLSIRI